MAVVTTTTTRRRMPWLLATLVVLGLVIAGRAWVLTPYRVESDSMSPTLRQGSTVLVDKLTLRLDDVDRQDLVMFTSPDGPVIKRVVAVAGDTFEMDDSVVIVNGERLEEPYVDEVTLDGVFFHQEVVPEGHVFVLGDNRFDSIDSRTYGPVPLADVEGRVIGP